MARAKRISADSSEEIKYTEMTNAKKRIRTALRAAGWFFAFIFSTVAAALILLVLAVVVLTHGPSEEAKVLFTYSCIESSALDFVPYLFLPDEEVDSILRGEPKTEAKAETPFTPLPYDRSDSPSLSAEAGDPAEEPSMEISLEEVKEGSYRGMMMIVPDRSRVVIGTLKYYSEGAYGKLLPDFIKDYGAVGGTNAGGFYDPEGHGAGGCPSGIVIENGVLRYGDPNRTYINVIGLSEDGMLLLGDWTYGQAIDAGVSSAVSFDEGWVLVRDGERTPEVSSGLNPRTAIGQRADGTILLLVVEGRHSGSLGATAEDLKDIMLRYDACNAAALDGGTSAVMFYEGEQLTRGSNLLGMRALPTAILVMPSEEASDDMETEVVSG